MKYLFSFLLLCVLAQVAFADKPFRYDWDDTGTYWTLTPGKERVADSTSGLVRDTLTFPRLAGATIGHAYLELTSSGGGGATDSFNVVLRNIPYYTEIDASGSVGDTLYWQTETADSSQILDWTAGNTYRSTDLRLYSADFYQFILLGSAGDNIFYTFHFIQIIPGKQ